MKPSFWFPIAVVNFTAAFFLYGELPIPSFVLGKAEVINTQKSNQDGVRLLNEHELINTADWICTGVNSRIELKNKSSTYRLGSMSVVSFRNSNDFKLHSGSFLFCTNKKGIEFKISSANAKATFRGSGTIIVETTSNGGFKFIPVEGRGILMTEKGGSKKVESGRMFLVLGKPSYFGDAYDCDLMLIIKSSNLINSYPEPLPTFGRISLAIYSQQLRLKGKFEALIGDAPTNDNLQVWAFGETKAK